MKTLTVDNINERKEVLVQDINMVKTRIVEYEQKVVEDKATLNALLGAFQQCDAFLKELDDDTPKEESDEG
jgi:hypothetical protein|tara:strand:- start:1369 stop:1581 length:213 start_codon:yes stop_codon:yes gene_type:complete